MKLLNIIRTAAAAALTCLALQPALAWDGIVTGVVGRLDFDTRDSGNVIVYLAPAVSMCGTSSPIITYLLKTSPGFSSTLAALQLAKMTGTSVTIYSNLLSGTCQVGYAYTP